ncbi:MAG: type II secretion system secretin GspD [Thiobacillus sp.]|uniref:type II secretion system secretin GspD n=1 Tax=Thiobacillus sp. TaxID=924 RepID=UPI002894B781|nr:type II secretion system secretin GspD [Thiobacillus sp.]MDT3705532.1 type II secretion system secretin GspD [Thiobacillus sp.]
MKMMTDAFRWLTARALLVALALSPLPARAQDDPVVLNFVNADIPSVIKAVGELTGQNFVIDPRVKGTVIITSARPVSRDQVYPILLAALRMQGFSAVEGPGVVKIVPEAEAKHNYSVTRGKQVNERGDRIITQVYPLQYESAAQMMPVLRPLIGPNNAIAVLPASNTLVITDYADNVRRLSAIISAADQPTPNDAALIRLSHVSAVDVAQSLGRLMTDGVAVAGGQPAAAPAGARLVIVPDVRSNSLLVRSDNPARIQTLRTLVAGLDVPGAAGGNIHVVYLRNAEAVKLAETLRGILSGEAPATATVGTAASSANMSAPAAIPGRVSGAAGDSMILADPATNSLVISAPDVTYNSLRAVIDKLDARRAQVFVEALVVEITAEKAAEFGIQWQDLSNLRDSGTNFIGGTNFGAPGTGTNIIDGAVNLGSLGPGLNVGVVSGTITIPGLGLVTNLGMLARALESDANANILSTPNLVTMDNEEAKIVVGQNVPFITGSYAQTGTTTTANPFQTIERQDVGLTLKVRPQVSEGGSVKLQIYQEISSLRPTTGAAADVITDKRSIDSSVLVDDGRIIVLGGLIQDSMQDGLDKVPLLGDIPVLGHFFKYEKRKRVKTNLMVFLRPHVLRDAGSLDVLTGERYDFIREKQAEYRMQPHFALPDMQMKPLPDLNNPPLPGAARTTPPATPGETAPAASPAAAEPAAAQPAP